MSDLDQLDIMRRAITALGLGQCAPEELVAEAQASSSRREEARRLLSDANVRIKDLESALRDLGVNPGGDLPGEVRSINNRTTANEAAAQHDLDCALRERDRAIDDCRIAATRIKDLEAKIATNIAEAAARDIRIADLERDLTAKDAALKRICEVIGAPAPCVAEDAVEAVKTLLCESEGHHLRADRAEATLAEMVKALSDHGAPRYYDDPSTPTKRGAQLSPVERLRVTLSIHHWKASAAERRAHEAEESREALLEERRLARDALLDMGAPCRADGFDLDLAARIRALPR